MLLIFMKQENKLNQNEIFETEKQKIDLRGILKKMKPLMLNGLFDFDEIDLDKVSHVDAEMVGNGFRIYFEFEGEKYAFGITEHRGSYFQDCKAGFSSISGLIEKKEQAEEIYDEVIDYLTS